MAGPRPLVEAIVGRLIPPACREYVLGDLRERCQSDRQYIWDATHTLPFVVWSQVRRTTSLQLLVAEAMALAFAFVAGVFQTDPWSLDAQLQSPLTIAPIAIPVIAALVALVLLDAYADPARRTREPAAVDGWVGVSVAMVTEMVLTVARPDLALSSVTTLACAAYALLPLSAARMAFPPIPRRGPTLVGAGGAMEAAPRPSATRYERQLLWTGLAYALGLWAFNLATAPTLRYRLGLVVALVVMLAVIESQRRQIDRLERLRQGEGGPIERRRQIERQRDRMRYWSAYSRPLLVGLLAFPFVGVGLMWLTGALVGGDEWNIGRIWWGAIGFGAAFSACWYFEGRTIASRAAHAAQQDLDALDTDDRSPED